MAEQGNAPAPRGRGRPGPHPATVSRARELRAAGKTRAEIGAELGVSEATVKRMLGSTGAGRPRLPDGEGSRTTRWRQQQPGSRTATSGEQG